MHLCVGYQYKSHLYQMNRGGFCYLDTYRKYYILLSPKLPFPKKLNV
jgi:hypothetical protein